MTMLHTRRRADLRTPSPALLLAIILASYLMIVLDVSIVTTALPEIRDTLGFSPTALSWVQNAYALTFGGLLLLGARAGDILGRRRTFVFGIALFTFASMLGGLAQSPGWLLAARALRSGPRSPRPRRSPCSPRAFAKAPSAPARSRSTAPSPERAAAPGSCSAGC